MYPLDDAHLIFNFLGPLNLLLLILHGYNNPYAQCDLHVCIQAGAFVVPCIGFHVFADSVRWGGETDCEENIDDISAHNSWVNTTQFTYIPFQIERELGMRGGGGVRF
jgi:hypothetical protein